MDSFANIMGWLVILMGTIGLVLAVLSQLMEHAGRLYDLIIEHGKDDARDRISKDLRSDSWYFSEDPATHHLLREIAEKIGNQSDTIGGIRDKWRAERSAGVQRHDHDNPPKPTAAR